MPKKKKQSKVDYQVAKCKSALLEGTVLAIDPSSGSASSLPGYALFRCGELIDSGVIDLKVGWELHRRLSQLATTLREDFEEVDVLVLENIPVTGFGRSSKAHASLIKAVGAILSSAKYKALVEISPSTWRAYIKRHADEFTEYEKSDEWDAIIMGYCILDKARGFQND